MEEVERLRQEINATETQLARLKGELAALEQKSTSAEDTRELDNGEGIDRVERKWALSLEEYKRYGRQMIVPQVGIQGAYFLPLRASIVC